MEIKGNLYAGVGSSATGTTSFAFGNNTHANGDYSHAIGQQTSALGNGSHAEGTNTTASGDSAHAEGYFTTASNDYSHAEGIYTIASGLYSHAEGYYTLASGITAHAEGGALNGRFGIEAHPTSAMTDSCHAEGAGTLASGKASHAEGYYTIASEVYTHAEGCRTIASGNTSHAEGFVTIAGGAYSHAEGNETLAGANSSHAEGYLTQALGNYSHAQGERTTASAVHSHAGGSGSTASGNASFIHSTDSLVSGARSAVIGGQNITGTTADTVYVPNFETRGGSVFNQDGGNFDFRVEGDTNTHLVFVDASTDRVGINNSAPDSKLSISTLEGDGISFDGMTDASLVGKHKLYTKQAEVATTGTNTATIATIPLVSGDRVTLRGMITALGGGSLVIGGTLSAVGYNNFGTASIIGTVDTSIKSANSLGSPTFTVSTSGGNIIITVTGGGENTQWVATYEYQIVAAPDA